MQRRSSQRATRKKYTTDAFASIPELRDASDSPTVEQSAQDDETDDAFDVNAESKEPSDVVSEGEEEVDEDNDDNDATKNDDEEIDDVSNDGDNVLATPSKKYIRHTRVIDENTAYTRGLPDGQRFHLQASRESKRHMYWGASLTDVASVQKAIDKWIHLPALPSREAGFHGPFLTDSKAYERSTDQDWSWCFEGTQSILNKQKVTSGSLGNVEHLLPSASRAFLLGSLSKPTQFMLAAGECTPLHSALPGNRSGYILNVGARVQCLEWLPRQPGSYQYLALATTTEQPGVVPCEALDPPAFTPTAPYEALLHIWRFNVSDKSKTPRLKVLISTKFGGLKRLRFCPSPPLSHGSTPILLGGLWSDGGLRVIELPSISKGDDVDVHHISSTVVETKAIDTVWTCFTWMSPRRIAAGCANGCIAVFDLQKATQSDCHNLQPQKYAAIAPTYILDIVACSPSCPTLLFTSSMDGFLRITDTTHSSLSSPAATIQGVRVRTILTNCLWLDYIRSVILTDDAFGVRLHLARRIFNLFTIGRTRSSATSMAISACHPILLIGTAAGSVQSLNPMIRVTDSKASVWQQTWFAHEWRRGQDEAGDDHTTQHIAKEGLSRFSEGYKPEKMLLSKPSSAEGVGNFLSNTVYEKPTAVSALSWNPNEHVGGWAAAGMADGLVRVEDIAVPT